MVGGIVDVVTNRAYSFFTGSNFLLSTNLLIIAGLATFIISFVAWGAVTVKRFILGIVSVIIKVNKITLKSHYSLVSINSSESGNTFFLNSSWNIAIFIVHRFN